MIVERILGLLAPHNCLNCGQEGSLVCAWCLPDFPLPVPSRCYHCSSTTNDSAVCAKCRKQTALKHVWVASEYEDLPKRLVQKLKFENAQAAIRPMAELIAARLPYVSPDTWIVHAPTATKRRRQRGYDQAELLARELARILHVRHASLLGRLGQSRQVGATRAERQSQLTNSYYVRKTYLLQGSPILLIDDILTTGATLEAASRILKEAGVKRIDAVVFAQKQ